MLCHWLRSLNLIHLLLPQQVVGKQNSRISATQTVEPINSNHETFNQITFISETTTENCSDEIKNEYKGVTIIIAFGSTFAGCGQVFFNTLGMTYFDNNIKKSKIPLLYSIFRFVRLLAPAIGLNTASYFLRLYVAPHLHPTIRNTDPRWIGAWWIGYIVFAGVTFFMVPLMAMFPRTLPRASKRKQLENAIQMISKEPQEMQQEDKASFRDLVETIKRLLRNKTYFCNTMAAIFYVFGYIPYGYFMNKYLQIQYLLTPSFANKMTGFTSTIASAVGLLTAGIVITIFKPRARYLAGWNIVTSIISAIGLMTYGFLGCPANNNAMILNKLSQYFDRYRHLNIFYSFFSSNSSMKSSACNFECHCDFVKYSPVCGMNGVTYISACHAGCQKEMKLENGTKVNCW